MEMEPQGPTAKKRRSEALETDKTPPLATAAVEAPNPHPTTTESRSNSPEPPLPGAGGGDGGGVDRISGLPDAILGEIISLLFTKDAARVQTLASRWRNIWSSTPLILDGSDLPADVEDFAAAVSRILCTHPGPGRRFCVPPQYLHDQPATVDAWLQSPALDNLQELDFWDDRFYWQRRVFPPAPPPASTFRFSATLRVATFSRCHLLDATVEGLHFPQIRHLALENVSISEDSLHTIIARCPALECLLLDNSFGFRCVRISSGTLTSIGVGSDCLSDKLQLRELIIVDAPCLERLLHLQLHMGIHVSVVSAPKLMTLGSFADWDDGGRLVFGTTTIQGMRVVSLTKVVCSVKILAVHPRHINLDMIIDLMKCFPCLEKLYIKSCISREMNLWRRKHGHFIKFFDFRLKTVVLEHYWGIKSQVNFASFFILNAGELEVMRIEVAASDYNEAFFAKQHKVLQMEKRASRGARLHFTTGRCHREVHVKHVRDLSIADPFECRCWN
uniref:Uncharacterized protein n=1 Tax=Arundo donax TaxID=35708 RepID=A0A0A9HL47_ARUDO